MYKAIHIWWLKTRINEIYTVNFSVVPLNMLVYLVSYVKNLMVLFSERLKKRYNRRLKHVQPIRNKKSITFPRTSNREPVASKSLSIASTYTKTELKTGLHRIHPRSESRLHNSDTKSGNAKDHYKFEMSLGWNKLPYTDTSIRRFLTVQLHISSLEVTFWEAATITCTVRLHYQFCLMLCQ